MPPCGTGAFVSGVYFATIEFYGNEAGTVYNLGQTDDGFEIEVAHSIQEITTDTFGDSVVDGIYRGGNCFVNMTLIEFNRCGVERILNAYSPDGPSGDPGDIGTIGCPVTSDGTMFKLLLSLQSPKPTSNQPLEYEFSRSIVDPNFPLRWNLNSRLRVLPLRVRALPDVSTKKWFTQTGSVTCVT